MDSADLFAVQLTPAGTGAIAVVLLAGGDVRRVLDLVRVITRRPELAEPEVGAVIAATLRDQAALPIDYALLIRAAPAAWELHLHGGIAVVDAVLDLLKSHGARVVTPQEAAGLRLLGPLGEGELQVGLARARTLTAARVLLGQPAALAGWAARWGGWLQTARAGDLWRFHSAVQWLLARSGTLAHLLDPPRIAIIGPPNAGKSTLANALLGRTVAITSDIPGTTRDWVDAQAVFVAPAASGGQGVQVAVTLIDTAGIRETSDAIESASIERARGQAAQAHAIIALFDGTREPTARELALAEPRRECPVVVAANKSDLAPVMPVALGRRGAISIAARTGAGLDTLMRNVLRALDLEALPDGEVFAWTDRQRGLLRRLALADSIASCVELLSSIA